MKRMRILVGIVGLLMIGIVFGAYHHLTAAPPEDLYDQATKLTSAYERKMLVKEAPVAQRLKLWNRQLDYALAHEDFTPEERSTVIASRQYLTPSYFSDGGIPKEVSDHIVDVFTIHPELYVDTFEVPGNALKSDRKNCKPPEAAWTWGWVRSGQAFGFVYSVIGLKKPILDCTCNYSISCNYAAGFCSAPNCRPFKNCGIFGTGTCEYACTY